MLRFVPREEIDNVSEVKTSTIKFEELRDQVSDRKLDLGSNVLEFLEESKMHEDMKSSLISEVSG